MTRAPITRICFSSFSLGGSDGSPNKGSSLRTLHNPGHGGAWIKVPEIALYDQFLRNSFSQAGGTAQPVKCLLCKDLILIPSTPVK